ncbi:hypothetical protein E2562_001535 [Oryza meyeriana var. granulata]|uniref:Uncharacterized protein n=1 Tax=Oryza meyeriana var. granulata TaxID=110450 RepID=A0A6G1DCZ1_9ORYZ|nr:hypothetical protein E2562_001535 [Oryza meyeriana var. granulata]
MYSLRLASSGTGLGFALGRLGGRSGGAAPASLPPGSSSVVSARARRNVSATPNAAAPTPAEQGVAMEQGKQPPPPSQPQEEKHGSRDDMHMTRGDVMTHSFGEGYSTRSEEEGFGGVYGQYDPVFNPWTEVHPSHPEYDATQGSEVKEKEKARHHKDDKHGT